MTVIFWKKSGIGAEENILPPDTFVVCTAGRDCRICFTFPFGVARKYAVFVVIWQVGARM
jgi:hypothetical protein